MLKQVMLDLETLDLGPDSLILAIGAVEFNPPGADGQVLPVLGREFYRPVSQELQVSRWGRTISSATVEWWSRQSQEAQAAALFNPQAVLLNQALADFTYWLGGYDAAVWGNGASFDNVVLAQAYKATSLTQPWSFKNDRCYRTLRAMRIDNQDVMFQGTVHSALDDAKYQALNAARWLGKLEVMR